MAITSTGRLVTFDRAAPALDTAIAVTGLQSGETILGIDVRAGGSAPGLYALGSAGRVYVIDNTTGVATLKSTLAADSSDSTDAFTALSGTEYGVDFDPVNDRLRVVSDTGQNLRINVDSGATITDTPLTSGGNARSGVNGAAYTNAFGAACRTSLYYIDANTDELLTTTDPAGGVLTSLGSLGVDASAVSDFEIATAADGNNSGYAVLVVGGVPASYEINLGNGAAATAGPVTLLDANEFVRDTTIAPVATPTQDPGDLYAVTESGRWVSFSSTAPQKVCTSVQFSGQQPSETILSVDVRPADQNLYALGSTGRLYNLDSDTGALTLKGTLVAQLGDNDPYTAIEGTEHGVDFVPATDALRIVGNNGFNARVQALDVAPPNGTLVITDPDLTPAGPTIGAGSYGNGVAGTAIGTFFMVDSTGDSLYSLGGLTGVVTQVGSGLGVGDVSAVGGFDIYGIDNRGIAALTIGTDTGSTLYSVQLSTGVATAVGPIGTGERVRSLTYPMAPIATLWGLTNTGRLVSFSLQDPTTFTSDTAVTGLQGGESLVAIDVRPADGRLYGLTSAGRLVPVDPRTGVAGAGITLTANPADAAAPIYTVLDGTRFGMDFHAFDDLLRIHSNTGQSLRVVTATGLVSQDTNLQPPAGLGSPQVIGTAYNNSYVGGASTVSFAIDAANNRVVRHASVAGTLELIGAGVDIVAGGIQAEGDMDIAGGENGLVLAALLPTGATQSVLYRIAPATGMGTAVNVIGPAGTILTDFAIELR